MPAAIHPTAPPPNRVGWGCRCPYAAAYMGTCLLFLAPALVTLALKVNALVGIDDAPNALALRHRIRRPSPCSRTRSSAG